MSYRISFFDGRQDLVAAMGGTHRDIYDALDSVARWTTIPRDELGHDTEGGITYIYRWTEDGEPGDRIAELVE